MAINTDLDVRLRLAVIQIESHQAAFVGGRDFLSEPFVDDETLPLDSLARVGLNVQAIKSHCGQEYLLWSETRLREILEYIASVCMTTESDSLPQHLVVVFPEYSIPFDHLAIIKQFVDKYSHLAPIVFAGTHTLPAREHDPVAGKDQVVAKYCETLEFDEKEVWDAYLCPLPTRAVMPVFYSDLSKNGWPTKSCLRLKRILSPFELTNMGKHQFEPEKVSTSERMIHVPLRLPQKGSTKLEKSNNKKRKDVLEGTRLTFWPLICSEALQTPTMGSSAEFDVAIIPAYHTKPEQFEQIVTQLSSNQHLAILANDGRYGGSCFELPPGSRGDSWWLGHPNWGRLPPGDSIIIADVRPNAVSERVRILNPNERCHLIKLSAIVPLNHSNGGYIVSESIRELRAKETAREYTSYALGPKCTFPSPKRRKRIISDAVVDKNRRSRVLSDCLELHGGTPLQALKLQRLLSLSDIDELVWLLHADDIVVGYHKRSGTAHYVEANPNHKMDPQIEVVERPPPKNLADLESSFAKKCLQRLEELENSGPLADEKQAAIADTRRQLIRRLHRKHSKIDFVGHSRIVSVAWQFLISLSTESRREVAKTLTDQVADLVAKYEASTAWLFAYTPTKILIRDLEPKQVDYPLRQIVSHNAPQVHAMSLKHSLAGACADQCKPILHSNVILRNDRMSVDNFHKAKATSRSGLAVPIFRGDAETKDNLVGVLVLESIIPWAFTAVDAKELQIEAMVLAMPVCNWAFSLSQPLATMPWYPPQYGWSITPVLNALCHCISTPSEYEQSYVPSISSFAMTIWRNDPLYAVAYAIGAARFDSDYIALRTLETFCYSNKPSGYEIVARSFVGSVLAAPCGILKDNSWQRLAQFSRQQKAIRTELDHVFCVSYRFNNHQADEQSPSLEVLRADSLLSNANFVVPPSESPSEGESQRREIDNLFANAGAVSWYTYAGSTAELRPLLDAPSLQRVAEMVGALVDQSRVRLTELAVALLISRLYNEGLTGQTTFNVIRDTLIEIFDADGCSIFAFGKKDELAAASQAFSNDGESNNRKAAFRNQVDSLACVSTSGIVRDGEEYIAEDAIYSLSKDESSFSVKVSIAQPPALRVNSRVMPTTQHYTTVSFNESFTLSQQEHRRTLFQSVPCSTWSRNNQLNINQSVGLVRVVRSPRKPPFTPDDAALLKELCIAANRAWDFRYLDRMVGVSSALASIATQIFEVQLPVERSGLPAESGLALRSAINRIIIDLKGYASWSRRQTASCVQDLRFICRRYQAVLAILRVVKLNDKGRPVLFIHTHHDVLSSEIAEEGSGEPIERSEGGIGWHTVEKRGVCFFAVRATKFTIVFPAVQEQVKSGLSLAFVLPTWKELTTCALSVEFRIEFNESLDLHSEIVLLVASALRLTRLSLDGLNGSAFPSVLAEPRAECITQMELYECLQAKTIAWTSNIGSINAKKSGVWCRLRKKHDNQSEHAWAGDSKAGYDPQEEFDRLMSDSCFDPLLQSSLFVNRMAAQGDSSSSRWFGRSNPEILSALTSLSLAKARIDFERRMFYLPLEAGGAFAGDLVGKLVVDGRVDVHEAASCMLITSAILAINKIWLDAFISQCQVLNTWDLDIVHNKDDSDSDLQHFDLSWMPRH